MSRITTTPLLPLILPSGVATYVHFPDRAQPQRQTQKLTSLTQYVQQHPQGWKKRLERAQLLYHMGDWEPAIAEYHQLLAQQPYLLDAWLQLGKMLQLLERTTEAITVYEHVKNLTTHPATQSHLTGLIALCHDHIRKALEQFKLAAAQEPDNAAHWLILGQTHLKIEASLAALQAFDTILKNHPQDISALIGSHDALVTMGYLSLAQPRLNRALQQAPHDIQALTRVADYRLHQKYVQGEAGKHTKQLIQTALQQAPTLAKAHHSLAYYYLLRGKRIKGLTLLKTFVKQHPNSYSGWYYYAQYLQRLDDFSAAAQAILAAYELFPNDSKIYQALCDILPLSNQLDRLQPLLEEMLERFPDNWRVWATAGRVLVEHFQDREQGCLVASQGPYLQPQLAAPWFGYSRVLTLAGRNREAREVLEWGRQRLEILKSISV